jgi:hypothetical protein
MGVVYPGMWREGKLYMNRSLFNKTYGIAWNITLESYKDINLE